MTYFIFRKLNDQAHDIIIPFISIEYIDFTNLNDKKYVLVISLDSGKVLTVTNKDFEAVYFTWKEQYDNYLKWLEGTY